MMRPEPDSADARARSAQAAEWLAKRDRGLSAAEQDAFLQWLADDPRHGEWLALHRRTVGDFNCLAQWRPEHGAEPNPDLLASPTRRRWLVSTTLAAAAGLALAGGWWQFTVRSRDHARTSHVTAQERRILEDGSAIELNRGAVVQVAFTRAERRVKLVQGEALFTVTPNPARPFVVQAGGVAVRAVGTSFNVRLDATAVEVLVTEGNVEVKPPTGPSPEAPTPSAATSAASISMAPLVGAGQRAVVSLTRRAPLEVAPVTREETARLLAWQPQLLDFSSAPLGRAVEEFNRRNRVRFVVADPELAAMPIVASIRSDNIAGFARILEETPGIAVERRGETEIVIRRQR